MKIERLHKSISFNENDVILDKENELLYKLKSAKRKFVKSWINKQKKKRFVLVITVIGQDKREYTYSFSKRELQKKRWFRMSEEDAKIYTLL